MAKKKPKTEPKEAVYDREISPLMAQIIAICKERKIAMIASFALPSADDGGLMCTTVLLEESHDPPETLLQAARVIYHRERSPLMVTTRDGNGKIVESTAIL